MAIEETIDREWLFHLAVAHCGHPRDRIEAEVEFYLWRELTP